MQRIQPEATISRASRSRMCRRGKRHTKSTSVYARGCIYRADERCLLVYSSCGRSRQAFSADWCGVECSRGGALRSKDRATGETGKRFRRFLLLALLLISALLLLSRWSWIDAQARTVVVLSSVLETPVLTPVVEGVTDKPRFVDTYIAGNPAFVVKPRGEGPYPAVFFVNGIVTQGRKLPEVRRLAEGLARAGYLVVVPDLPGLRWGEIRPETVHETAEVARAVSELPDARDGEVSMVGVSTGATLALLAAEREDVAGRTSVVAGVAPYADVKTVLDIATTGHYKKDGRLVSYEADPFLAGAITQSLVSRCRPARTGRRSSRSWRRWTGCD